MLYVPDSQDLGECFVFVYLSLSLLPSQNYPVFLQLTSVTVLLTFLCKEYLFKDVWKLLISQAKV